MYTDLIVIVSSFVTTVVAITSSIIALAKPNWRHILVCVKNVPVLNGTEGLWKYCQDEDSECMKLNTDDTGGFILYI